MHAEVAAGRLPPSDRTVARDTCTKNSTSSQRIVLVSIVLKPNQAPPWMTTENHRPMQSSGVKDGWNGLNQGAVPYHSGMYAYGCPPPAACLSVRGLAC